MNLRSLLLVLAASLSTFACAAQVDGDDVELSEEVDTDESAATGTVNVTSADNGKIVRVKPGQKLVVSLGSNPTTGFDWLVSRVDSKLGTPKKLYVSGGSVPGASGTTKFTWQTKTSLTGRHVVELQYKRAWETTTPASKTFKFTVDAR